MNISIGIVGLPNVGKSTLFNALLKRQIAEAANYPFCTIEPNVGVVEVPDHRLQVLYDMVKDRDTKIIPAVVKFVDIAGLVKGAASGEGLGNQFLSHIRECQMILEVVRDFSDENVIRAGAENPESDMATIKTELILKDLETVTKLSNNKQQKTVNKLDLVRGSAADKLLTGLNQGLAASEVILSEEEMVEAKNWQLLTMKPIVYVLNVDESRTHLDASLQVVSLSISAKMESELSALSDLEQKEYLAGLGLSESGLDRVIKICFHTLGLQTFLTAGPKEVRAWTIRQGAKGPEAAGAIHGDFERGFISAEVCHYDDYIAVGGWSKAKELGKVRLEGREYVMKEGDIVEFRFSV
ncbi:MAG: redox-regulated ATPase YchF [candidate division WWE3 bacterium]|nr:redox-regulated ATPase YchF [candidate division WWE3 bacterium]